MRASLEVDIDLLEPNDYQPRGDMEDERLQELARSIQANGIIQPIVARRSRREAAYQIIAGERRWRAAQRAGSASGARRRQGAGRGREEATPRDGVDRKHPARESQPDRRSARLPEARQRVRADGTSDVAAQVGKDRSSVANTLRLLRLPEEVATEVASGRLSMGHARAIVSLASEADQRRIARDVLARGLSVRETEAVVKKAVGPGRLAERTAQDPRKDVHTRAAEEQLRLALGTAVEIKRRGKGGVVEIAFANEDELQRIYEYLTGDGDRHGAFAAALTPKACPPREARHNQDMTLFGRSG